MCHVSIDSDDKESYHTRNITHKSI